MGDLPQRIVAISDVHGCTEELSELLEKVSAHPRELILLGDYVDSGPDSAGAVRTVMTWVQEGAVALLGNHDELFLQWLQGVEELFYYGRVGGMKTINSFLRELGHQPVEYEELLRDREWEEEIRRSIREAFEAEIQFLAERPLTAQREGMLFVHAGIEPKKGLEKTRREQLLHIRDEFIYGYAGEQIVVFGHTRTRRIHGTDDVYFGPNRVIGIDGGCAFGGQLNALVVKNGQFQTVHVVSRERR